MMYTGFQTVFLHILCLLMSSVCTALIENVNNIQERRNRNALLFMIREPTNSIHNTLCRQTSLTSYFVKYSLYVCSCQFSEVAHLIKASSFMGPSLHFLYEPFLRKLTTFHFISVSIKSYIKVNLSLYLTN
jgi:hypothetical protein